MQNETMFKLAQLTDVHLGPLPTFWPWHWNVKRSLGFLNLKLRRREFDDPILVHELVADLKQQSFDHIAVTGDLTNLGMPAEFAQSLRWLKQLGPPSDVTAIPGNHDLYTRLLKDTGIERWRSYMSARPGQDAVPGLAPPLASGFPFVRTFGRFALINLNSAVYMPPAVPAGRVGDEQTARFVDMSRELHKAGYARIVTIHHPPLPEHGHRCLRDAAAFEAALLEVGAELLIHGHNHRDMIAWRDTSTGPLAMVGAGSAGEGAYNIYELTQLEEGGCHIEYTMRRASGPGKPFAEVGRKLLDPNVHDTIL